VGCEVCGVVKLDVSCGYERRGLNQLRITNTLLTQILKFLKIRTNYKELRIGVRDQVLGVERFF